jgi:hypothetical protein
MPKLPVLSGAEVIKALERLCFEQKRKAPEGAFLVRGPLRKRTANRFPTFQLDL